MKGDKLTKSRYRVKYTNKGGKRISRVIIARTGWNAELVVTRNLKGRNVSTNKLKK